MLAYIDTSVLLRYVLSEPGALPDFLKIDQPISSELIQVETFRTLDRYRVLAKLSDQDYVDRISVARKILESFEIIHVSKPVLDRACQPFPTAIGTLDAIHLSSCLLYSEHKKEMPVLFSHDESLKMAAKAAGIETQG